MTEEELSQLTIDEKLKVTSFLIADLAAKILGEDPALVDKARHQVGGLSMIFSNFYKLITSLDPQNMALIKKMHKLYRFDADANKDPLEP